MTTSDIKVKTFTGSSLKSYLPAIARLRLEVLSDSPYLYHRQTNEEMKELQLFSSSQEGIGVLVFDKFTLVGASLGIPLSRQTAMIQKPFAQRSLDPSSYFYFSEALLMHPYRGRGIGHYFFDLREEHVKRLKRFTFTCFPSIVREEKTIQAIAQNIALEDFWRKQGYSQHHELFTMQSWKDVGEEASTTKKLTFWVKEL